MDPSHQRPAALLRCFPRTRGDGPGGIILGSSGDAFPPHARGWTFVPVGCRRRLRVSPARAGMDRPDGREPRRSLRFPRTRGDGPQQRFELATGEAFPPHARGWTLRRRLRHALLEVSPARAGMDPLPSQRRTNAACFPRTRGDGPQKQMPPEHGNGFPPHARGWTLLTWSLSVARVVSPARAGMDLVSSMPPITWVRFPRTRGDGPASVCGLTTSLQFPPHARGWTEGVSGGDVAEGVSPARAGMDRRRFSVTGSTCRFPRTRGDGPIRGAKGIGPKTFPPHARGWTGRSYD